MADPPSRGGSRAQSWTASELRRFLDHVTGIGSPALWRLAATTGMRRGELAGLTWRALDLDGARLSVEQQFVPTRGGATFGPPKSARSRRTVALDPETVDALRRIGRRSFSSATSRGRVRRPGSRVRRPARPRDPPADADGVVLRAPEGGRDHERKSAHAAAHGRDVGTHDRRAGAYRRCETRRHPTEILKTYAHLLPQSDEMACGQDRSRVSVSLANRPQPCL